MVGIEFWILLASFIAFIISFITTIVIIVKHFNNKMNNANNAINSVKAQEENDVKEVLKNVGDNDTKIINDVSGVKSNIVSINEIWSKHLATTNSNLDTLGTKLTNTASTWSQNLSNVASNISNNVASVGQTWSSKFVAQESAFNRQFVLQETLTNSQIANQSASINNQFVLQNNKFAGQLADSSATWLNNLNQQAYVQQESVNNVLTGAKKFDKLAVGPASVYATSNGLAIDAGSILTVNSPNLSLNDGSCVNIGSNSICGLGTSNLVLNGDLTVSGSILNSSFANIQQQNLSSFALAQQALIVAQEAWNKVK
jgi:hypothetical protein